VATGLLLAVLVNQKIRGRALFRTLFYLPAVVPPVAAALTFRLLFDRDAGAVNAAGDLIGASPQAWLTGNRAFVVIVLFVIWGAGTNMVISLAALQEIPAELTEAARVDGASAARTFRSITLPLLSPVLFFQVVTGVIFAVQTFIPALLLSSSGSAQVTAVPDSLYLYLVHVYTQAFGVGRLGYASALLWLLFAVLVGLTVVIFRISGRAVFYTTGPGRGEV
jgi:multiple sugar transport system permease protein